MTPTEFTPIQSTADSFYGEREPGVRSLDHQNQKEITDLLMGHKVTKVDDEHLMLDNGTVIKAIGAHGGCSCGAGDYDLSVLNGVDNIITRVDFDYRPDGDDVPYDTPEDEVGFYRIFVFADAQQINLMQFDGSDGNGYYGTGFEILIREVTS